MTINIAVQFAAITVSAVSAETLSVTVAFPFTNTGTSETFAEHVEEALGISESGSATKFLNEQGDFVTVISGGGDMLKSVYDTTNSGTVDTAKNSLKFGGQFPAYYATVTLLDAEIAARTALDDSFQAHAGDYNNPHQTSLEQARTQSNEVDGDIDANGNTVTNLATPVNPGDAVPKSYVDGLIDTTIKVLEGYNPTGTSLYPVTYNGSAISKGDSFKITVAGSVNGIAVTVGDFLIAQVDTPGQTDANWMIGQTNVDQATESVQGIAKIATQAQVEDENSTNNVNIVSPQKLWLGLARFTQVAWTWALKQIFTTAPRFSSANASEYLKTDGSKDLTSVSAIPASDVSGTKTSAFISDFNAAALAAAPAETVTTIGTLINGATEKTTPALADMFGIMDSAAGNVLKKLSFTNLIAFLTGYFVYELGKTTADSASSSSTSEVILDAIHIPAGKVTEGHIVKLKNAVAKTGTAGALTHRVRINTSNSLSGATQLATNTPAAGILWLFICRHLIVKANSGANSTYVYNTTSAGPSDETNASAARSGVTIDWTVDQYILFTGQLANGADSMLNNFSTIEHI